jgi:hypothetical protein
MRKIILLSIAAMFFIGALSAQEKTTMGVSDLQAKSSKYIKKHYKDYKTTEAFEYAQLFGVKIQEADTTKQLAFDAKGNFLYIITPEIESGLAIQQHVVMVLNDIDHSIKKYVDKNYKGYAITEAVNYELTYEAVVVKGADQVKLMFDSNGDFLNVADPSGKN